MVEALVPRVRNSILSRQEVAASEAKAAGCRSNSPDVTKQLSISGNQVILATGRLDLESLQMRIEANSRHFKQQLADIVMRDSEKNINLRARGKYSV